MQPAGEVTFGSTGAPFKSPQQKAGHAARGPLFTGLLTKAEASDVSDYILDACKHPSTATGAAAVKKEHISMSWSGLSDLSRPSGPGGTLQSLNAATVELNTFAFPET